MRNVCINIGGVLIVSSGKFYTYVYNAPQLMEESFMFISLSSNGNFKKEQLETVNIDKDGIVSLNHQSDVVKAKIKEQILKLKQLNDENKKANK